MAAGAGVRRRGGQAYAETESHLIIASDMGFLTPQVREDYLGHAKAIQRMLAKLIANLP